MKKIITLLFIIMVLCSNVFAVEIKNNAVSLKGQWDFNLQKVWEVSSAGDDLLGEVRNIQVAENGRIYFHDFKLRKFFLFHPDGKLLLSFGRRGEGPGEYRRVQDFFLVDNILVVAGERKILYFTKEGKLDNDIIPGKLYKNAPRAFLDKNRFINIPLKSEGQNQDIDRIEMYDIANKKNSIIAEIAAEENTVQVGRSTSVVFAGGKYKASVILCVKDKFLYYGKNDKYKITRLDLTSNKSMIFTVLGKKRHKIPKAEKERFQSRLSQVISKEKVDRAMKAIPDDATYFFRIDVDDTGLIYVYPTNPEGNPWTREVDIFSPEGKYLYHSIITFPEAYAIKSPLVIKGDYLHVFLEDKQGEGSLVKYKIDKPRI
jgi:6-bladed beta-propeller